MEAWGDLEHGQTITSFLKVFTVSALIIRTVAKVTSASQDFDEGSSKLNVKGGVNDRIEGTVDVAEPGKGAV